MLDLNKLNTGEGIDLLAEIVEPISNIIDNEELLDKIYTLIPSEDEKVNPIKFMVGVGKIVPKILRENKKDIFTILSVFNQKSVEEIETRPVSETIKEIATLFKNKDIINFFSSLKVLEEVK